MPIDAGTVGLVGVGITGTGAVLGVLANLRLGRETAQINRAQLLRQMKADDEGERDKRFEQLNELLDRARSEVDRERSERDRERADHERERVVLEDRITAADRTIAELRAQLRRAQRGPTKRGSS